MSPTSRFSEKIAIRLTALKQRFAGNRANDPGHRQHPSTAGQPPSQRILFVCMGNICRSPLAEAVTRGLAQQQGLSGQLTFDSAGTHGHLHQGSTPDQRAQRVGARHGYDLSKMRARPVIAADFDRFDRILAMDAANLAELKRHCPVTNHDKLALFLDYAESLAVKDVPDPYYGTEDGFERVLELCEQAARGLLSRLTRETRGASAKPLA